jgi:Spy/CpxP family protein refolding chaperone
MRKEILVLLAMLALGVSNANAQAPKEDVFKGKLFAPNVILEQQEALNLTKDQYTEIRAAVVEVQTGVAEHEWDMREAYQALMLELDRSPIDDKAVMKHVNTALLAENQVKKKQVAMLVKLKNLLTAEQIDYLESVVAKK